jgi:hypothetical protein
MTFRVCPTLVASAIVSCAFASACSSTPATPRAFVDAQLTSGASGGQCNFNSAMPLVIGSVPGAGETVNRVSSGSDQVSVTCTVHGKGNNTFHITAQVTDNSSVLGQGGSLRIEGDVTESGGGSMINTTLNAAGTAYMETDCTISLTGFNVTNGLPPAPPAVASGRIWGSLRCPNALSTSSGSQYACVAAADFVFENCAD